MLNERFHFIFLSPPKHIPKKVVVKRKRIARGLTESVELSFTLPPQQCGLHKSTSRFSSFYNRPNQKSAPKHFYLNHPAIFSGRADRV